MISRIPSLTHHFTCRGPAGTAWLVRLRRDSAVVLEWQALGAVPPEVATGPGEGAQCEEAQQAAELARNEEERRKEMARKEEERRAKQFEQTPPGRARLARRNGQRFFQVVLSVEKVDRTWLAKLSHEMDTRVDHTGDVIGAVLTEIEDEGWELVQAGFAFRQTGHASRDKFLASGQQVAVMGETVGVYLFKARVV